VVREAIVAVAAPGQGDRGSPLPAERQNSAPYFHGGSAVTLIDVVAHYNRVRSLGLTTEQQRDLVECLKSL
jgi:hypothetical protein